MFSSEETLTKQRFKTTNLDFSLMKITHSLTNEMKENAAQSVQFKRHAMLSIKLSK